MLILFFKLVEKYKLRVLKDILLFIYIINILLFILKNINGKFIFFNFSF